MMALRSVTVPPDGGDDTFRRIARSCLAQGLHPDEVVFDADGTGSLFEPAEPRDAPTILMPRRFVELVSDVVCHSAEDRFALLYRLLWRVQAGERNVLEQAADPDVQRAQQYAKAVARDVYRMHAFTRFRERMIEGRPMFVAWFEPQHNVLRKAAPFFADRFTNMDWIIATPCGTAAWQDKSLHFGPPVARPPKQDDAVLDEVWSTYYRITFNPARLRVNAMLAQMPKRHWPTMPETTSMPQLVRTARTRVKEMEQRAPDRPPRFADVLSERQLGAAGEAPPPWEALKEAAHACRQCPLHAAATQMVFGEGPLSASMVFVGEQPGDQEDLQGRPFVGPAGQVFDRALAQAGIDRGAVYVTNAVKHFKFEPRGKRRIHQKPGTIEVTACRHWLRGELDLIRPKLVVSLGATAALSLAGRPVPVTKERGSIQSWSGRAVLVTVHPSYLLRLPDPDVAAAEYDRFVADLRRAKLWCERAEQ
ncbi:UdgX family uracil-DNA binding protein [Dongia deserti]|uniref:UdgX family uracil-DNA binding protein n=1 Tax=Dongia deserti TaxID=2268030 RepID=UPI000E657DBB|nr:UdgX family uracil-DNA binding protein [Dongia deserti]